MKQIGRYRLESVHGFGAFATVWRGFDTALEIPVAVKILAENWANHADVRERFLSEARILRRIADERVVRVYDVGSHEGQPFFVMDFITGGTLADRVDGTLDPLHALTLAAQAARAVQVLHDGGVLHRDIKPSNLLIGIGADGTERVLVSDLGSAKQLADASGLTVTTGTPAYMAPEQALGRQIDERTDVYALGVVAYELLSGAQPFDVSDPGLLLSRSADDRPPALSTRPDVPAAVDNLLARTLSADPQSRPPSAAALADALERLAGGARDHGLATLARSWGTLTVVILGVVAFAVSAVLGWWLRG